MKTFAYPLVLAAAITTMALPVFGQVQISQDGRPERIFRPVSGLNQVDKDFLNKAAIANILEIQASEVAEQKNSSPFVGEYAKEMLLDFHVSIDELKGIATAKGVELPTDLPYELQHEISHLENLSGDQFDQAFRHTQKMAHEEMSDLFREEIDNGKDQDVMAYCVKTLPSITLHYKMLLTNETMMGSTKMEHGQ